MSAWAFVHTNLWHRLNNLITRGGAGGGGVLTLYVFTNCILESTTFKNVKLKIHTNYFLANFSNHGLLGEKQ